MEKDIEKKEMTLTYLETKSHFEISYLYGRSVPAKISTAIFIGEDQKQYEYRYNNSAKTEFASTLNDLQQGDKIVAKFSGEEHYHKGKEEGEKIYYYKMLRPERTDLDKDRDMDEPELLF